MRSTLLIAVLMALAACTTQEVKLAHSVPLAMPATAYAESDLLDVGVVLFDSGLPEGELTREQTEELMRNGTFIQIRRAESMFLPVKLRETLQRSGHWGTVQVTPNDSTALDVNVRATILQSDGNILSLAVTASDATGRIWFERDYSMETAASAYNRQRYPNLDPYQDVFNEIANDLAAYRAGLDARTVDQIRTVGELRYASELSPEAFGDYLEAGNDGVYEPVRLPAVGDPMLRRARSVRQSEQVFFETLDQYYEDFALDAAESYSGWREYYREDSIRVQEAARAAKLRTGLGALAIALSIAYGTQSDSNSFSDLMVTEAGIYIGNDLLRSAAVRRQERRLHEQSLQELSEGFDDEVKPMVVDVRGTQHRLTGTAEIQFEEWRGMMRDYFSTETGLAIEDVQVYADPEPLPLAGEPADGDGTDVTVPAVPDGVGAGDVPVQAAPGSQAISEPGALPLPTPAEPAAGRGQPPAQLTAPPAAAGRAPATTGPAPI